MRWHPTHDVLSNCKRMHRKATAPTNRNLAVYSHLSLSPHQTGSGKLTDELNNRLWKFSPGLSFHQQVNDIGCEPNALTANGDELDGILATLSVQAHESTWYNVTALRIPLSFRHYHHLQLEYWAPLHSPIRKPLTSSFPLPIIFSCVRYVTNKVHATSMQLLDQPRVIV